MERMIRTLLFDIDDTLLNFRDCAEPVIRKALSEFDIAADAARLAVYHHINNALWHQVADGTLTREGLYAIRWQRVLDAWGVPLSGAAVEARFRHHLNFTAIPEHGAEETLRYLAERYTLCTASNAPQGQQEQRLASCGLARYFTQILTSEGLGVDKPAPLFFERCLHALGDPDPDTVMMLGDSPEADIRGARAVGLHTCLVNTRGVTPPPDATADYTVTTLSELRAFL